jgi:CheY-like chemotaxis protein
MGRARVTVINDSEEFLDLMREVLQALGHEMTGMQAVKASLDDVLRTSPDLLIVDLNLANPPQQMSGWELIVLARSEEKLTKVPIIVCTADIWELRKRQDDLARIADVHVLEKPFEVAELHGLIERLLPNP